MGTIEQKLQRTKDSVIDIKNNIIAKGVPIDDTVPLREYGNKIAQISGGIPVDNRTLFFIDPLQQYYCSRKGAVIIHNTDTRKTVRYSSDAHVQYEYPNAGCKITDVVETETHLFIVYDGYHVIATGNYNTDWERNYSTNYSNVEQVGRHTYARVFNDYIICAADNTPQDPANPGFKQIQVIETYNTKDAATVLLNNNTLPINYIYRSKNNDISICTNEHVYKYDVIRRDVFSIQDISINFETVLYKDNDILLFTTTGTTNDLYYVNMDIIKKITSIANTPRIEAYRHDDYIYITDFDYILTFNVYTHVVNRIDGHSRVILPLTKNKVLIGKNNSEQGSLSVNGTLVPLATTDSLQVDSRNNKIYNVGDNIVICAYKRVMDVYLSYDEVWDKILIFKDSANTIVSLPAIPTGGADTVGSIHEVDDEIWITTRRAVYKITSTTNTEIPTPNATTWTMVDKKSKCILFQDPVLKTIYADNSIHTVTGSTGDATYILCQVFDKWIVTSVTQDTYVKGYVTPGTSVIQPLPNFDIGPNIDPLRCNLAKDVNGNPLFYYIMDIDNANVARLVCYNDDLSTYNTTGNVQMWMNISVICSNTRILVVSDENNTYIVDLANGHIIKSINSIATMACMHGHKGVDYILMCINGELLKFTYDGNFVKIADFDMSGQVSINSSSIITVIDIQSGTYLSYDFNKAIELDPAMCVLDMGDATMSYDLRLYNSHYGSIWLQDDATNPNSNMKAFFTFKAHYETWPLKTFGNLTNYSDTYTGDRTYRFHQLSEYFISDVGDIASNINLVNYE